MKQMIAILFPILFGLAAASDQIELLDGTKYDGKLIKGWQVTPGFTFSHSFYGDTPTFLGNYLQGAKALNLYVLFNQNPAVWQAGMNFTSYFGGKQKQPGDIVRQLYRDRDFVGAFVSRSF